MFIVFLRFGDSKGKAGQLMDGHRAWIKQGFEDGVFLLAGSLVPGVGGSVLAHNTTLAELQERVSLDPFVEEAVVTAEIWEVAPSLTDKRLAFLAE